jgi:AAA domain
MLVNAAALDTRPPQALVKGILPRKGAGFLYGKSNWGKSLITNGELALAIANGELFFGREVVHGSVVVCYGEGLADAGLRKEGRIIRQQRADEAHRAALAELEDEDAAGQWWDGRHPYTDERLFIETDTFQLALTRDDDISPDMALKLDELAQIPDLELVVIDALGNYKGDASLSHESGATRIMAGMHAMAAYLKCCVLVVHHPTAKGDKMLGADKLLNSADFVWKIEPGRKTPGGLNTATLICEKSKYFAHFDPIPYLIEEIEWEQPATDDNRELIPGAPPELVSSATVRQFEPRQMAPALRLPQSSGRPDGPAQLRLAQPVTSSPPKRTGLLRSAAPAATRGGNTFALKGM